MSQTLATETIRYSEITPRPWKNGRGITRNLFDDAAGGDEFTWRMSIAEITGEQPYSSYPGIHREQVALGPGAVDLRINGEVRPLPVEGVTGFDGEDEVSATPHAEGFLDLNVMVHRDSWVAEVAVADDPTVALTSGSGDVVVLVALADGATVGDEALSRLDAVKFTVSAADNDSAADGNGSTASAPEVSGRFVVARISRR